MKPGHKAKAFTFFVCYLSFILIKFGENLGSTRVLFQNIDGLADEGTIIVSPFSSGEEEKLRIRFPYQVIYKTDIILLFLYDPSCFL